MIMRSLLPVVLAGVALVQVPSASGQPCDNGVVTDGKSCCVCEPGFAPPECSTCADGYMLGTDGSGKKVCYNGVTNCHNDLPAPFGCNGRGTCTTCPAGDTSCKPECECLAGYFGKKCEQTLSPDCEPDSVHMYTVFPQQPVSGQSFSVQLWGCNIIETSSYKILPGDMSCNSIPHPSCNNLGDDDITLTYNSSEVLAATGPCTTCGECIEDAKWSSSPTGCANTPMTETVEWTLAKCLSACYDNSECGSVAFDCTTGSCQQYSNCQPGQPTSGDVTRWVLAQRSVPPTVTLDPRPVSAAGRSCYGPDATSLLSCLVTFDEAKNYCDSQFKELCTLEDLQSEICCTAESKCEDGRYSIWTSDSTTTCAPMAQSMNGCPTPVSDVKDLQRCESANRKKPVACCTTTGRCYATKKDQSGCYGEASTYAEAEQVCQSDGMRLCTPTEVGGGACCGQGCSTSNTNIWIATTPSDPSNKCTDDQIAGTAPQQAIVQTTSCSSKGSEQCADKNQGLGGIRCCQKASSSANGASSTRCDKSAVKVSYPVIQNKNTGCFALRNRDQQPGVSINVRLVAPLNGLCTGDTCGCKSHVAKTCADPANCPSCKAAIELCDRPGLFLQLQGNVISFNPSPENMCDAHSTEVACLTNPNCFWSVVCKQQSVVDFLEETEFSLFPSQFDSFSTIQNNGKHVARGAIGTTDLSVVSNEAGQGSEAAWTFGAVERQSSTEASIRNITITVPTGVVDYKVCQKRFTDNTWRELQTHTLDGYRTSNFTVYDTIYMSGAADGDGEASGGDCDTIPFLIVLLILMLCLLAVLAAMGYRKYHNTSESERNNKKYSDFDAHDGDEDFDVLEDDTAKAELEPEC